MLKYINYPSITVALLAAFMWLAQYSYKQPIGKMASVKDVNNFVAFQIKQSEIHTYHKPSLKQRQAAVLKDVYQLSEADVTSPVQLWRKQ